MENKQHNDQLIKSIRQNKQEIMDELNRFRQQLIDDHIFPNSQSAQYNFEFRNSFLQNNNDQDVISHRNADERISNLMGD